MVRRPVTLLVLLAFVAGCTRGAASGANADGPQSLTVGEPVPSFTVPRLDGSPASLRAYRGRAVFANVWATWCPPCRHEMPAMQRIARAYASRGLLVVGIDQGESDEVVRRFVRSIGVTYPILMDHEQRYGTTFEVFGLPTTVFVRRDGTVERKFSGELNYEEMRAEAERLTFQPAAAAHVAPPSRERTSTAR